MKKRGKLSSGGSVGSSLSRSRSRSATTQARAPQLISRVELTELHDRLRELTETVDALRTGAVDAVVVSGPEGSKIYSLAGADHPYRIYFEGMQEGAVTVSPDGVILYTNKRFSEMLQMPLERVIGSDIRDYVGEEAWQIMCTTLRDGSRASKQVASLRRDAGPALPVSLAVSGLEIDTREMLCLVVTDLTEQFANTELRIAKESAERASVAKDDFLAALSHELRTPLTPALVSAATIEADPALPAHLRDEISVVRRNVELEARLIDDLLDLTRIARGKLELHASRVDVHQILDDALAICLPDATARNLQLEVHKEAVHTHTRGDAIRLQQVFWNLLRNAVKFTPESGRIIVRTHTPADDRIGIDIVDTGIGFDAAAAQKIFNAFEQGGRDITRQFGGLGLGLAISRSITEAHGGSIRATSEGPGRGARFSLELPIHPATRDEASPEPVAMRASTAANGLRILLVEDHKDTRLVLERVLQRNGHEVLTAGDARTALDIAGQRPFDLVISDLGLPDQSGLELMRSLRDRFGLRGIAVSGYGMEEDVSKSHEAGFVHHLTKPVSVQRLRQLIESAASSAPVS